MATESTAPASSTSGPSGDKKVGLLLGLMKPASKEPVSASEPSELGPLAPEEGDAKTMAAKGMMSALKEDDAVAFTDALETFLAALKGSEE